LKKQRTLEKTPTHRGRNFPTDSDLSAEIKDTKKVEKMIVEIIATLTNLTSAVNRKFFRRSQLFVTQISNHQSHTLTNVLSCPAFFHVTPEFYPLQKKSAQ